jgi:uncharacterized protein YyaL (SSP411 family)
MSAKFRLSLCLVAAITTTPALAEDGLHWSGWNDDVFARAKAEKRFVILDLEAVWCHWCHVMDQMTYADPKVQALVNAKYLPVRVDQDSDPALSTRYGDWGWPATIVLASDGTEIAKLRGYIEPERMASLLQAIIDDPSPGPSVNEAVAITPATTSSIPKADLDDMLQTYTESFDADHAGWGGPYKYIDADSMDYAMARAEAGDKTAAANARQTCDAAQSLIDPVWGGAYQYSVGGVWTSPHFEKIMSFQAQYLRQYSQAYALWHDEKYLKTATALETYLTGFLMSPDGAFYVSQDADLNKDVDGHAYYALDDAARRKLGMPRVDTHLYARENGWAISGLVAYSNVTNDAHALSVAERAAKWVRENRALPGGGFRHAETDKGGPFLGDTLAMGKAFIDLYAASGERQWLTAARQAGDFIAAHFKDADGGFVSAPSEAKTGVFTRPSKPIDDQILVARFMNELHRYIGAETYGDLANHAMRYAVSEASDIERPLPGVLLADAELSAEPTHITIVGHKDDPEAQRLDAAARAFPANYKRLDWWDTREGPLPNPDVQYPELDQAAAFACANHICSLPSFSAADLQAAIEHMANIKPKKDALN